MSFLKDKPFLLLVTWKSIPGRRVYALRKTSYELTVNIDGSKIWKENFSDKVVSFETVFNNSTKKIRRQLAFHLDFFNS